MISKVIVTSGPTREWIDPVRYISNASSGKMGFNLAQSAKKLTTNIVYIAGGVDADYAILPEAKCISVETTDDLLRAVLSELEDNTLLIMAAAPADYKPLHPKDQKMKKQLGQKGLTLEFTENPDILKNVSQRKKELTLQNFWTLGFSAETESLEKNAKLKLEAKGLDWIAGNKVGKDIGFGEVESEITLFFKNGDTIKIGPGTKEILAEELIAKIQEAILSK
ncbi:MAG: phosphopantothenoylcysteine decarboxylase [Leptospira sp.]|nr:phosphopantothenoylcysteine decarboxylase [Leptospira sp.]NCS94122.1 phosphopantothenoylcysteine decarboxylase [Leptospira sp.]